MSKLDITGEKFGRLTVVKRSGSLWECLCDCGNTTVVTKDHLKTGHTKSCGCLHKEVTSKIHAGKSNAIDLIGQKFGKLTVISRAPNGNRRTARFVCRCDCGNTVTVLSSSLRGGHTKSCGCLVTEKNSKHGYTGTKTYDNWIGMIQRCENSNNKRYPDYGARGIKVCDEWHDFENFLRDMGEKPEGMSIDRKDNNGDYCKDNCKWSTPEEQANNRRSSRKITYNNKTLTVSQWAREYGINRSTLDSRLRKGVTFEDAIGT